MAGLFEGGNEPPSSLKAISLGLKPDGLWRVLGITSFQLFDLITWLGFSEVFPNQKANAGNSALSYDEGWIETDGIQSGIGTGIRCGLVDKATTRRNEYSEETEEYTEDIVGNEGSKEIEELMYSGYIIALEYSGEAGQKYSGQPEGTNIQKKQKNILKPQATRRNEYSEETEEYTEDIVGNEGSKEIEELMYSGYIIALEYSGEAGQKYSGQPEGTNIQKKQKNILKPQIHNSIEYLEEMGQEYSGQPKGTNIKEKQKQKNVLTVGKECQKGTGERIYSEYINSGTSRRNEYYEVTEAEEYPQDSMKRMFKRNRSTQQLSLINLNILQYVKMADQVNVHIDNQSNNIIEYDTVTIGEVNTGSLKRKRGVSKQATLKRNRYSDPNGIGKRVESYLHAAYLVAHPLAPTARGRVAVSQLIGGAPVTSSGAGAPIGPGRPTEARATDRPAAIRCRGNIRDKRKDKGQYKRKDKRQYKRKDKGQNKRQEERQGRYKRQEERQGRYKRQEERQGRYKRQEERKETIQDTRDKGQDKRKDKRQYKRKDKGQNKRQEERQGRYKRQEERKETIQDTRDKGQDKRKDKRQYKRKDKRQYKRKDKEQYKRQERENTRGQTRNNIRGKKEKIQEEIQETRGKTRDNIRDKRKDNGRYKRQEERQGTI
ncbi:hypothetical protein ANN_16568 [Periplaneta americana]|uniref:Uncharacterized protein n=1 Tax=Periplaneta americana TaxID=6978 RepID=A0ABQ8SSA1_PERAM|nr:hypothetical protein ANN_16568 [Periplaneta americana]